MGLKTGRLSCLFMFLGLSFIFLGVGCNSADKAEMSITIVNDGAYFESVKQYRVNTNELFYSANSPLADSLKPNFEGVNYFPVDTNYKVIANFEPITSATTFSFPTTGDIADKYRLMGKIHFTLQNEQCVLEVYLNEDAPSGSKPTYFIPFYDLTNNVTTYGGGRFLDIPVVEGNQTIIDFNMAYQPFCVYNHDFSCPIPPLKNKIPVAVLAGERL